ncbi:MAG: hypothetical protein Q9180_008922, partial [Flavoplaca navasiana]
PSHIPKIQRSQTPATIGVARTQKLHAECQSRMLDYPLSRRRRGKTDPIIRRRGVPSSAPPVFDIMTIFNPPRVQGGPCTFLIPVGGTRAVERSRSGETHDM